jgi:hypothetical protein
MGKAARLFDHFVDRQDSPNGRTNYGRPWTIKQIQDEIEGGHKIKAETWRDWARRLKKFGYIDTKTVRFGHTVRGFTVTILNPKKWALQMNLPFEERRKILEFGAGRPAETGSRNRSCNEKDSPPKPLERSTVRHRELSSAMRSLENQLAKAERLRKEIGNILGAYTGGNFPEHTQLKLEELTLELRVTHEVIHEYELRLKAAG